MGLIGQGTSAADKQRIFISYRRGDTQWLAGRLADSLAAWFGDERVFRDVEGIAKGADFGEAIGHALGGSGALLVLIGEGWLGAVDDEGNRRLEQPGDWVVEEITNALAKGMRIYPVLVEDTPMPRASELPEALRPLVRFNALSLSDGRWDEDVARLARAVSFDIPSTTDRWLRWANLGAAAALYLAIVFTVTAAFWGRFRAAGWGLFDADRTGACVARPGGAVVAPWTASPAFVVVVAVAGLMLVARREVDPARKPWFTAAGVVGGVGTLAALPTYLVVCNEYEGVALGFLALVVAPLMLALVGVAGFRGR